MKALLSMVAIAAMAVPGLAQAQVRGGEPMGPNQGGAIPLPQDIRPMGFQQHRYRSGFEYTAHFEEDQCKQLGCIIVVNKSANFEITEFFINDGDIDSRGLPLWGANQFQGFHLDPGHAVWTVRPRKMNCETLVRVVLENRKTKEKSEGIEVVDLCAMSKKGGFAILNIQGEEARVILEDGS
ncbi:MAG: hypothetical protein ACAH11_07105 [Sphingomonas sp.]